MTEVYSDPRVRLPKPRPHDFQEDLTLPAPGRGKSRPCRCGLPEANAVHDEDAVAAELVDVHDAQADARRRTGERED